MPTLLARLRPGRAPWRLAATALALGTAWQLSAQGVPDPQDSAGPGAARDSAPAARIAVPFGPGERLTYEVRFGVLKVGTGVMELLDVASVRGREAYHTRFRVRGGTFFYKVDDLFESWFDTGTLASLRFNLDQNEGRRDRERKYEIFPDRQAYREGGEDEQPSVANPLDEGSFLYYVRTLPLRPGDVYEVNRYFRPTATRCASACCGASG
jgi:hypothetical protein